MDKIRSTRHATYFTNYHIVWIPKYRRRILTGNIALAVEESLRTVAREKGWEIIALEVMPKYDPGHTEKHVFSGKRVKRGLYRSKNGQSINANLNGAANILRKAFPNADLLRVSRALCLNPTRLYPLAAIKRRSQQVKQRPNSDCIEATCTAC